MCFAPQRRALLRHLNLQKWREHVVFCTFWLWNVLRATTACFFSRSKLPKVVRTPSVFTTACTFSTSQLVKVVRSWCVLYILTCKCASRHNGVQFFISHLASWLRTRRFSEPTFRPSYLFAHLHLPSSYSFSSTLLSSNLSLLFASSLLCFSSLHIVGSLTSKLPSMIMFSISYSNFSCVIYIYTTSIRSIHPFYVATCTIPMLSGYRRWKPIPCPFSDSQINAPKYSKYFFLEIHDCFAKSFFLETALLGYLGSRDPEIIKHSTFNQTFNSWNCVVVLLWFQYRSAWVPDFPLDVLGR